MSSQTTATGGSMRHIAQHRKEPSWTVADLAATVPGGRGAKIVVAGMAGAALAIPAMSAFASPASLPTRPGSGVIAFSHITGRGTVPHARTVIAPGPKAQPDGQVPPHHRGRPPRRHSALRPATRQTATGSSANESIRHGRPSAEASDQADSAAQGPGLLLEPDGTFVTLARSATNVHTVSPGSLIIMPDGTMMRPLAGPYATMYGLISVSQVPGSGTSSAAAGPPTAFGGGTAVPAPIPPPVTAPPPALAAGPAGTMAPAAGPAAPAAVSTAIRAPAAAAAAAGPPVQIVSALGGVTVAGNGTVVPTGNVSLAFPGSGIGGSLPLSLPSGASAQPAQLAFPPADPNPAPADPVLQGLTRSLGQPPSANPAEPIMNPPLDAAPADAAPAPAPVAAGFTSSDPTTAGDPIVVASGFGSGFGSG